MLHVGQDDERYNIICSFHMLEPFVMPNAPLGVHMIAHGHVVRFTRFSWSSRDVDAESTGDCETGLEVVLSRAELVFVGFVRLLMIFEFPRLTGASWSKSTSSLEFKGTNDRSAEETPSEKIRKILCQYNFRKFWNTTELCPNITRVAMIY